MLRRCFRSALVLARLRSGVLGPILDPLAARLHEQSRSHQVIRKYIRAVGHFSHWLGTERVTVAACDGGIVRRFTEEHLPHCRCPVPVGEPLSLTRSALGHVLVLLGKPGLSLPARRATAEPAELASFRSHLREVCGMAPATSDEYCRVARWFLCAQDGQGARDLARLAPNDVVEFVSDYAGRVSRGTARQVATALRGFLRWLQFRGLCDGRLVGAVPRIPYWKLASIPKLLTDDQVGRLLEAFDRSTDVGRRDYAMALCLVRLGMRSCEVAQLRLDDIDWRAGTVRIDGGKRRRSHVLPLPSDLAKAVVAYLRHGRPRSSHRGVFLRHTLPHRPMRSADVQTVVRKAHERGQVGSPWKGTHVLRHTMACRLLRSGATLKEIADILGHRSIDTTAIYAKVDIERLAGAALPWPEAQRP